MNDFQNMHNIPMVIRKEDGKERVMDLSSVLHGKRTIYICNGVDEALANIVVTQLLVLADEDATADINLYICSGGGSIVHGLAIYDAMLSIGPKVNTFGLGMCASMGAFLLSAGTGVRTVLPNCRVMIHQPSGGANGRFTADEQEVSYLEMQDTKKRMYTEMSKHTGVPYEKIVEDCKADNYMSATEAVEYGLACEVSKPNHVIDRCKPA